MYIWGKTVGGFILIVFFTLENPDKYSGHGLQQSETKKTHNSSISCFITVSLYCKRN